MPEYVIHIQISAAAQTTSSLRFKGEKGQWGLRKFSTEAGFKL